MNEIKILSFIDFSDNTQHNSKKMLVGIMLNFYVFASPKYAKYIKKLSKNAAWRVNVYK